MPLVLLLLPSPCHCCWLQIQLRLWFPAADVSQMISRRPTLLLDEEFNQVGGGLGGLLLLLLVVVEGLSTPYYSISAAVHLAGLLTHLGGTQHSLFFPW